MFELIDDISHHFFIELMAVFFVNRPNRFQMLFSSILCLYFLYYVVVVVVVVVVGGISGPIFVSGPTISLQTCRAYRVQLNEAYNLFLRCIIRTVTHTGRTQLLRVGLGKVAGYN